MECSPVRGQQERQLPSPFLSTASPKGSRISLLGLSPGIPTGSSSPGLHPSLPSRLRASSFSSRLGSPGLWSPFLLTGTPDSRFCFGLWDSCLSSVPASSLATAGGPGRGGPGEGCGTGRGPEGGESRRGSHAGAGGIHPSGLCSWSVPSPNRALCPAPCGQVLPSAFRSPWWRLPQ